MKLQMAIKGEKEREREREREREKNGTEMRERSHGKAGKRLVK